MNTYYMIVMHRATRELIVILRVEPPYSPIVALLEYADWAGFELKDLLWNTAPCHNFSEVIEGKDILTNVT